MTIRPMDAKDVDSVFALEKASFSMPWSREDFAFSLRSGHYVYLVAEDDSGRLLGYAGFQHTEDEADVVNVAVDQEYRRQGIAGALMRALLSCGREKGIRTFFLEVRDSNEAAVRLYESLGFVRIGVRRDYYRNPREDARVYALHEQIVSARPEDRADEEDPQC